MASTLEWHPLCMAAFRQTAPLASPGAQVSGWPVRLSEDNANRWRAIGFTSHVLYPWRRVESSILISISFCINSRTRYRLVHCLLASRFASPIGGSNRVLFININLAGAARREQWDTDRQAPQRRSSSGCRQFGCTLFPLLSVSILQLSVNTLDATVRN